MSNEIFKGEMMNEAQLDEVVGGSRGELSCDTKFFHALGLLDSYHEPGYVENHVDEITAEITAAVQKIGNLNLKITYSPNGKNQYLFTEYDSGGVVSRTATRDYLYKTICKAVGQPDFNYKQYL